jgi:putative transposase
VPRRQRQEEAGAIHHVFARGNRAEDVFWDAADRRLYLRLLARAVRLQGWRCLSYCLMTNHLHLLLETPEPNLGLGMRGLHGDYALEFNKRHGLSGHVFQGRFGAVRVKDDAHLLTVIRYIDRNPTEAGLAARPEEWPWCSARALRGGHRDHWLATDRLSELLPEGWLDLNNPQGV